jgi:purine-binding chemotaxis protein CheW
MDTDITNLGSQYLSFKLDQELFAVEIGKVREVLEFGEVTKVPRTPDFMRGVINLRGSVVPVVDMRMKLGLSPTEKGVNTCVVISEVSVDGQTTILGALVDSVQEVLELDASSIAPPPSVYCSKEAHAIRGMGKRDEHFIMILDFDRVFTSDDLGSIHSANGQLPT